MLTAGSAGEGRNDSTHRRRFLRPPARVAPRGNPSRQPAMNAAIVDTDVVSMLFKGDTRALGYYLDREETCAIRTPLANARGSDRSHGREGVAAQTHQTTRSEHYRPYITGRLPGISFMTLAELERWPLPTPDALRLAAGQPRVVWQMGRGFLLREAKRAPDPNSRRLDSSECPLLSGPLINNNRDDDSAADGLATILFT